MTDPLDDAVLDMLAEREITRVLHRYASAVDSKDIDAVAGCYWADGHDTHADFSGSVPEYLEWLSRVLPALGPLTHQFTNITIDIHPGRTVATSEAYCLNVITLAPADGTVRLATSCLRYDDDWERREGEWRISTRRCRRLWTQANPIATL